MKYLRCKEEIEWWRKHLATKDTYLKNRCAGVRFDKIIKDLIKDKPHFIDRKRLKIADFGCGPASVVGTIDDTYDIDILGIDPLIDEYNKILEEKNLIRPHDTRLMECEDAHFLGADKFDIVFSRNAIDHSERPDEILMSGKHICKPNGLFHIRIYEHEGQNQNYEGIHQWNFFVENNNVSVASPTYGRQFTVKDILGDNIVITQQDSFKNSKEICISYFKD